jgi:hypothetical protein
VNGYQGIELVECNRSVWAFASSDDWHGGQGKTSNSPSPSIPYKRKVQTGPVFSEKGMAGWPPRQAHHASVLKNVAQQRFSFSNDSLMT